MDEKYRWLKWERWANMEKTNRTPGPWEWIPSGSDYLKSWNGNKYVTVLMIGYQNNGYAQINASDPDRRLIAAAPDLYEACQAFVVAWEKCLQLEKTDVALKLARAALAKVDGQVVEDSRV
jgi:hypothetical protein